MELKLNEIKISGFWSNYQKLIRDKVIPYQWEVLHDRVADAAKSHCIKNFEIAAGLSNEEYYGVIFLDSDLYKWLESVSNCLAVFPEKELETLADGAIELISKAQGEDGYLNTYYTVVEPKNRFTNLCHGHELYCAGHLFEAAVAHFYATGKRNLLEVAAKFADYLCTVFGADKLCAYPGHPEIELALIKLYKVTDESKYLELAKFFVDERGNTPNYFDIEMKEQVWHDLCDGGIPIDREYSQSHIPVKIQTKAVGHAVRAVYLYSAMADIATINGDEELKKTCEILYEDIVKAQMYVTGAIGQSANCESFTTDYDLPSDSVYGETCAAIGLMKFSKRMAALFADPAYFKTVERALYNVVLSGISLSGTRFFYVNPLEVVPERCAKNPSLKHVKTVRQKWFDVACCPTNIARTIMSVGAYAFSQTDEALYINLYVSAEFCGVKIETEYPYGDEIKISNNAEKPLFIRINDKYEKVPSGESNYTVDMSAKYIYSNDSVAQNNCSVAVMRGSLVYCAEEIDNKKPLGALVLPNGAEFTEQPTDELGGTVKLKISGERLISTGELYSEVAPEQKPEEITLIPYHLWANRGENEMRVFLNKKI